MRCRSVTGPKLTFASDVVGNWIAKSLCAWLGREETMADDIASASAAAPDPFRCLCSSIFINPTRTRIAARDGERAERA
jgi:hypothetical protein